MLFYFIGKNKKHNDWHIVSCSCFSNMLRTFLQNIFIELITIKFYFTFTLNWWLDLLSKTGKKGYVMDRKMINKPCWALKLSPLSSFSFIADRKYLYYNNILLYDNFFVWIYIECDLEMIKLWPKQSWDKLGQVVIVCRSVQRHTRMPQPGK